MKVLLVLLLSLVGLALCQTVPSRPVGHYSGSPSCPIVIDIFADLQCIYCANLLIALIQPLSPFSALFHPFSSQEAWPKVKQVLDHYGDKLRFGFHAYPLIFHHQAFDAHIALETILNNVPASRLWDVVTYIFENQSQFSNDNSYGKSRQQLMEVYSAWGSKFGVNNATMYAGLVAGSPQYNAVRLEMSYAYTRLIYQTGTPTFTVNGFTDPVLNSGTTVQQWIAYVDDLLQGSNQSELIE